MHFINELKLNSTFLTESCRWSLHVNVVRVTFLGRKPKFPVDILREAQSINYSNFCGALSVLVTRDTREAISLNYRQTCFVSSLGTNLSQIVPIFCPKLSQGQLWRHQTHRTIIVYPRKYFSGFCSKGLSGTYCVLIDICKFTQKKIIGRQQATYVWVRTCSCPLTSQCMFLIIFLELLLSI
jgi:hypothetical protein